MFLFALLLLPGQALESQNFPRSLQMKAVTASVRIVNRSQHSEGSGVLLGKKDAAVYVLTAAHLAKQGDRLEVSTFSESSYPSPVKVYDQIEVVARTRDIRDLALLRFTTPDRPPASMPLCPLRQLPAGGDFEALSVGCGAGKAPLCMLEKVLEEKRIRRPPARETVRFWLAEVEQAAGRSGGPLVDRKGRLIGLASGANEGKGYYCHGREVLAWLKGSKFAFLLQVAQAKPEKESEK